MRRSGFVHYAVASLAEAWIETPVTDLQHGEEAVASLAEAWIETTS